MTAKTIYRGEGLVKRWGDSSSALRTVTLQLQEDNPLSRHPFFGFDGRRVAVVIVELDETELAGSTIPKDSPEGQSIVSRDTPPAKPNSTRAVMMAKDPEFWSYMTMRCGYLIDAESKADLALKEVCGVRSKSDLNASAGAKLFDELRTAFREWRRTET